MLYRALTFLLLTTSIVCTAESSPGDTFVQHTTVQTTQAWDGFVKNGHLSDIRIELSSQTGGPAAVLLTDGINHYSTVIQLEAGIPKTITQSVYVGNNPTFTLELNKTTTTPFVEQLDFRFLPKNTIIIANTSSHSVNQNGLDASQAHIINLAPNHLPRTYQAYQNIDLLVVDDSQLLNISNQQRQALHQFVQSCGQLAIYIKSGTGMEKTLPTALCAAKNIYKISTQDNLPLKLLRLSGPRNTHLSTASLKSITQEQSLVQKNSLIVSIIMLFFIIMLVLIFVRANRSAMILTPMTVCIIILLTTSVPVGDKKITSWSEITTSAPGAFYSAVLHTRGQGQGTQETRLPEGTASPVPGNNKRGFEVTQNLFDSAILKQAVALYSVSNFYLFGYHPMNIPASIQSKGQDIVIHNLTDHSLIDCYAKVGDRIYYRHLLKGRTNWIIQDHDLVTDLDSRLLQLFIKRSQGSAHSLLLSGSSSKENPSNTGVEQTDWLLINDKSLDITDA